MPHVEEQAIRNQEPLRPVHPVGPVEPRASGPLLRHVRVPALVGPEARGQERKADEDRHRDRGPDRTACRQPADGDIPLPETADRAQGALSLPARLNFAVGETQAGRSIAAQR